MIKHRSMMQTEKSQPSFPFTLVLGFLCLHHRPMADFIFLETLIGYFSYLPFNRKNRSFYIHFIFSVKFLQLILYDDQL